MATIAVNTNKTASSVGAYVSISIKPDLRAFDQFPISTSTMTRTLAGSLPGGKQLMRPILIVIEYDEEEVVVSEPLFHMHASAPTEIEALDAFRRMISGYLDVLARREKTLGPPLLDQLNYLRSIIIVG